MKDYEECWRRLKDHLERWRDEARTVEEETEKIFPDLHYTHVKLGDALQHFMQVIEEIEQEAPQKKPEVNQYARRWHTLRRRIEEKEVEYKRKSMKTISYAITTYYYGRACGYTSILKEMEQLMSDEEAEDA